MTSTIVFVTDFPDAATAAQEITPSGFELAVVAARSQEYKDALKDSSYLVGFVDSLVDDELFETGPNLKLIQLLSAGYDRADIEAARKAGVPIANNGGANSVAVSEHAVLLMLAVSRQLVRQHTSVAAGNWRGNETPRAFTSCGTRRLGSSGLAPLGRKPRASPLHSA